MRLAGREELGSVVGGRPQPSVLRLPLQNSLPASAAHGVRTAGTYRLNPWRRWPGGRYEGDLANGNVRLVRQHDNVRVGGYPTESGSCYESEDALDMSVAYVPPSESDGGRRFISNRADVRSEAAMNPDMIDLVLGGQLLVHAGKS